MLYVTSIQIYKGLDIVTAKATLQERQLVPHHLLDILEPHQNFTVVDFRNRALKIIDELTKENKVPIIVGGTNYYIESIIYKILVEDMNDTNALLWDQSKRKRDSAGEETETNKKQAVVSEGSNSTPESKDIKKDVEVNRDKIQEDVDNEAKLSNEEIHAILKAIDPKMAARLHPNNRRKVLR
ncbi:unnamed protein product [Pieris macdunnoughi]|uniref:Isopentenyltransferase n=1 Tax=Pieris macdunnoughi TaxID=345717 RepID=A0A821SV93_9NEOP|nr:unnamed protein product [Pieris macdunnoughi]